MVSEPPFDDDVAPSKRRALWVGAIVFGLVRIPVKLHSAVVRKEVRFRELHDADGAPLREERICTADGERVPWEHVAKGFCPIAPERYVMATREELAALEPEATKAIEIESFAPLGDIDPIHYDAWYHVVPDRGGERSYDLLARAMGLRAEAAIGRFVMRNKAYLCAIRSLPRAPDAAPGSSSGGRRLCLATLHHADELVPAPELPELDEIPPSPRPREIELAEQLVASLSAPFDPERLRDEHRERVLAFFAERSRAPEAQVPASARRRTGTAP